MKPSRRVLFGCLAVLALPLLVLGALFGPAYLSWVEWRARRGAWGLHRQVNFDPEDMLVFSWRARSESEAQQALRGALAELLPLLPAPLGLEAVHSLDVENPPSGFCIDPQRLPHSAVTADFATQFAAILDGQHAEDATLVVNGSRRVRLGVDTRSFVQGHLEVELPEPPGAELLAEAKQRYEV